MTPKQMKRNSSKKNVLMNDEDCENEYGGACSSGKNSRRKSSVIRMRELQMEEDSINGAINGIR